MGGKKLGVPNGMGKAAKHEDLAELEAAEQLIGACRGSSEHLSAASETLPAPRAPASSSEIAASSGSPSLSPQPPQHLHDNMSHRPHAHDVPSRAGPAAQAPAPAAQDDGTWQEVRGPRRRSVRQHDISHAIARRAPTQGRETPDQGTSAPSPPLPELQAAAQHAEQAPPSIEQAAGSTRAEPVHVAAQDLPIQLSASVSSKPQEPLRPQSHDRVQSPQMQPTLASSMRRKPLQRSPYSNSQDAAHAAPQHMPHYPDPSFDTSSHEQVRLHTLLDIACLQLHLRKTHQRA